MIILSFKNKRDKEKLYEKAKKMEEYASMIVECLEEAGYSENYEEEYRDSYRRSYRDHDDEMSEIPHSEGRYGYRGGMR